ncbi:MAG: DEAD/DEAH box helicase [Myxococcales bacterium]|nr:DEAD/DEAH box helicase [Myxococcales bacterium]
MSDPKVARHIAFDHREPSQDACYADIPGELSMNVQTALRARGMTRLYSHQAEAFQRAQSGENLVIATPTASGKSLCYNLPVLHALSVAPDTRALYLFPTKALSRDQEEHLRVDMREAGVTQGAITYDGDTPGDARRAARERAGVLVTNPDMVHAGILPNHAGWARFFANLKFVVVDEVHVYRGVLGSHLANVLRRLQRVAAFHGSHPQFLFSSATISNPSAHASRLLGSPVGAVCENGAPSAQRRILVYNPPLINAELGMRRSYISCAVDRAVDLLKANVSTLVFGQSRNNVEVMLKYLRDRLPESELAGEQIQAYRGGYLPETRRRIERGLREGEVRGVVATNALELGIDIGGLDAVICAGYPGTMAALWQRFGRGGRRGRGSLAMLVPSSSPLDQYLAQHPSMIIETPVEEARIDPDNIEILIDHLKCAAFELQFRSPGDTFGDLSSTSLQEALEFLETQRMVRAVSARSGGKTYHWSTEAHPASHVSLRSLSYDNFVIIDVFHERVIGEMDFRSSHTMLHEQAIYQHEGQQYQVEQLDYENHKAFVRKVEPDYYTSAQTRVRVSVLEEEASDILTFGAGITLPVGRGEVDVVEKVIGYKKIRFHTHENVGYGEVYLPAVEKATTAFWIVVPELVVSALPYSRVVVMDGLRGWLKALRAVAAVGLMMDPRDLGSAFVDEPGIGSNGEFSSPRSLVEVQEGRHSFHFEPTMYLFDAVAGGIGLAQRLWEDQSALVRRSAELIDTCPCQHGCPSCVGPGGQSNSDDSLGDRKSAALAMCKHLGVVG